MPTNDVRDISYGSGNPTKTGAPMDANPSLAPYQEGFIDNDSTPATVGQLVVAVANATTNPGGPLYALTASANQVFIGGEVGVVVQAASAKGFDGMCVKRGMVQALCTTTGTAISAGSLLSADGAGNLTVAPSSPTPGQIVARAYGTLASSTSTPTLVLVCMGQA